MSESSATVRTAGGSLRMSVEIIEVAYMAAPDKAWRYIDRQGHEHHYGDDEVPYPTLLMYHALEDEAERLECAICGEDISPGLTGPGLERIAGRASYYLDDKEITADEYARRLSEHQGREVS